MKKRDKGYLADLDREGLLDVIDEMIELLDEGDQDDTFGTEGWRHRLGWDE